MLIDVTVPQLGESVAEGTISKWLVREGDVVKKDQPLVSIATDKADSDLPAPAGGRVTKLLAAEGQVVPPARPPRAPPGPHRACSRPRRCARPRSSTTSI
jgi:pyruvate/2-oxoglutarate dehydrogenase complex dihydrolipoamide acyltransferase (E2) component